MSEQTLTFVVGTGRSGSTALSRILRAHPGVLSLNELLASVGADPGRDPVPARPLSGVDFWHLLAEPNEVFDRMIRSGAPLPEFLYPRNPGRWSAERTGIPALCLMVLPHLSDEPDALLDALEPEVTGWPTRPAADHYRALFRLLGATYGSRAAVERSGYSLGWVPRLRAAFPEARFVHLHRDGPDCAVSMSRHPGYRMIIQLREITRQAGVDSLSALTAKHVAALPPHLAGLLHNRFDPALVLDRPLPVAEFGRLWSQLVTEGAAALDEVPAGQRTALAYEDLLDHPEPELTRLALHIGVEPDPKWLAAGVAELDG
ncbi:sulfotransferase family protein, partial [Streptomyces sparsus]